MTKNYVDFVEAMHQVREDGKSVSELILTPETMDVFLTDGDFTDSVEDKHDGLGEFAVAITTGNENCVLTESGEKVPL